jgi:hypothetical protein
MGGIASGFQALFTIHDGPVIGAIIAGLGYVAKLLFDSFSEYRKVRRQRAARLVELDALLHSSRVSFEVQQRNVLQLLIDVARRDSRLLAGARGYENKLLQAQSSLVTAEEERRKVVQGITIYAMRPTNQALVEWMRTDDYYRAKLGKWSRFAELAEYLAQLEAHLLLWLAKYDAWMGDARHNVIYLDDEEKHGLKFPRGIDHVVDQLLRGRPPRDLGSTLSDNLRANRLRAERASNADPKRLKEALRTLTHPADANASSQDPTGG